jgi:cellulose synthase/poly-beta-1,6-N-acetylglucosamine synthase-like glycosyltransferase
MTFREGQNPLESPQTDRSRVPAAIRAKRYYREKMPRLDVTVVVPVFNEEGNVEELYGRTAAVLDGIDKSWELIFVDDGSHDRSDERGL